MSATGIELEKLIVRIVAETNDYLKPLEKVVKATEDAAARIEQTASKMAGTIAAKLPDVSNALDKNIVAPLKNVDAAFRQSTLVAEQSINRINAAAQRAATTPASIQTVYQVPSAATPRMPTASPRTSPIAGGGGRSSAPALPTFPDLGPSKADDIIADWNRQMAGMKSQLDNLAQSATAASTAKNTLARAISGVGTATTALAPFLGILNADLGLATFGAGNLTTVLAEVGPAGGTAALALGTFSAALVGTTYALGGMDAVKEIPANLLEGLKYGLYAASAGFVDLTEKTRVATQAQADFVAVHSCRALQEVPESSVGGDRSAK